MRKLHPVLILLLATLFVGQTVAGVAAQCADIQQAAEHQCCCETVQHSAEDCGCYDAPDRPANTEPVVQVQPTPIVATLSPAPASSLEPHPRRLTTVRTLHLPAPPPLRAHDVRAPPVLW